MTTTSIPPLLVATIAAGNILLSSSPAFSNETYPLREAVECTPRDGLPHLKAKIEAGESIKVAYLGGSITAAAGWRVQSLKWLQEQYPEASFEGIHAAIGGTGSDLGVFRLQRDVLRHEPDLLFVEFAVNDGGAPPERIHQSMEGIVRQARRADASLDICFVYTVMEKFLPDLQNGKMPRAASAMEEVADHYRIPSIHFGVRVAAMEQSGELVFSGEKPEDAANSRPLVFSKDGVHPFVETGHRLYIESIANSWPAILEASGDPGPSAMPTPLRTDNWEEAKLVPIRPDMLSGQWEQLTSDHPIAKRFQRNLPEIFLARSPGAKLSFTYRGSYAGIFDLLGPDGGQLAITIDGSELPKVRRIDGYCTYHRMSKLKLASEERDSSHEVEIELTGEKLDKREILFESNREFYDAHPEKYEPHLWYAGALMVIGEIE